MKVTRVVIFCITLSLAAYLAYWLYKTHDVAYGRIPGWLVPIYPDRSTMFFHEYGYHFATTSLLVLIPINIYQLLKHKWSKTARLVVLSFSIIILYYYIWTTITGRFNYTVSDIPGWHFIIYPFVNETHTSLLLLIPINMYLWLKRPKR